MTSIQINSGAIDASGAIGEGFELVKKNYWMYFGITILAMIMIGCIPIVNLFLMGPVLVGVYYVLLREMNGEPVEFGMMFKGFEKFVPAMVVGLIQNIPGIIFQIVQWVFQIGSSFATSPRRGSSTYYQRGGDPDLGPLALFTGIYLILVIGFVIFSIIWHLAFFFTMPILAEHDVGPIEAIKLSAKAAFSNVGGLILLIILEALVGLLGVIALCVGIFFVMPIIYAANAVAYRYVFPRLTPTYQTNAPPPPDVYGGSYGQGM